MKKRLWIIPLACTGAFLLAYGILFFVALSNPTWEGPWGRYLANAFQICAIVSLGISLVFLCLYLVRKNGNAHKK